LRLLAPSALACSQPATKACRATTRWSRLGGVPCVDDALAAFACTVKQAVEVGDHVVLFGAVAEFDQPSARADALVFYAGAYTHIAAA
jgi:flavin reductase (DIM6/NTAB) family NADH-FMN oxidoreductase RutF